MLLSELISGYLNPYPAALMLEQDTVEKMLKKAVVFYCGFAELTNLPAVTPSIHSGVTGTSLISDPDIDLTPSEWSIIRPLFELYVEKENALHLEASRSLGVDVFGRTASEVAQEILQAEEAFPLKAFYSPCFQV